MASKPKDISRNRYGRLTAIRLSGKRNNSHQLLWECLCDCGRTHYATVNDLNQENVKSCGCLQVETQKRNLEKGRPTPTIWTTQDGTQFQIEQRLSAKYSIISNQDLITLYSYLTNNLTANSESLLLAVSQEIKRRKLKIINDSDYNPWKDIVITSGTGSA